MNASNLLRGERIASGTWGDVARPLWAVMVAGCVFCAAGCGDLSFSGKGPGTEGATHPNRAGVREAESAQGHADCNSNGFDDAEDIAAGTSDDCDSNGGPDECQTDCNTNGVADACETDCNTNDVLDDCDLAEGTSSDCDSNGVPDECQPDCNTNGVVDACDVTGGTSADCNTNGVPDDCDITGGTSLDCNTNGLPDECDIEAGSAADVDGDGVLDACDLCPGSDAGETLVIGSCDTGVLNVSGLDGCGLSDAIAECADGARNHGGFVSCVAHLTNCWRSHGLITDADKGNIQSCAAHGDHGNGDDDDDDGDDEADEDDDGGGDEESDDEDDDGGHSGDGHGNAGNQGGPGGGNGNEHGPGGGHENGHGNGGDGHGKPGKFTRPECD